MKGIDMRVIYVAIVFFLAIISGVWVTRTGRPLNNLIFTIHKLIALTSLVLTAIIVKKMSSGLEIPSSIMIWIVITWVLFAAMVVTGGALSFDKLAHRAIRVTHSILPLLTVISAGISFKLIILLIK